MILVVQYHPLQESLTEAVLDRVLRGLERSGADYVLQRIGTEGGASADISSAEELVLVYPSWASGLPGEVLKWAQSVLATSKDAPQLRSITAVTTYGSSRFVNWVQGEWGKHFLRKTFIPKIDSSINLNWLALYKIDRLTLGDIERHLDVVEEHFAGPDR